MKRRLLPVLLCLMAARIAHAATCSPTTFITSAAYPATSPIQPVLADLNGDGFPDLVVRGNSSVISILLNQGDGTFGLPTTLVVSDGVSEIAVADLRGNGKIDIVSSTYGGIDVLLGNGDGTFAAPVFYPSNSWGGSSLAVGKFDANDTPDAVLIDQYGQNLEFFPGNGNGTFGAPSPHAVSNVFGIIAGDFNGDSRLDLVASNGSAGTIAFYPGLGNGSFGAPSTFLAGPSTAGMAAADMNGDGILDVAATSGGFVSILLGNGDGSFQAALQYPAGYSLGAIAIADLDQDGLLDVAVVDAPSTAVEILFGTGGGALGPSIPYLLPDQAIGIAVGDLDGDGWPDVVSGNGTDAVAVLKNGGGGAMVAVPESIVPSSPGQYNYAPQIAAGDWNGDGRQDLAWIGNFQIDVVESVGGGRFAQIGVLNSGDPNDSQLNGVAAGDLDGDGRLDLVSTSYSNIWLYPGNGDGTFAAPRSILNMYEFGIVAVADFTGDGKLDVVATQNCCGSQVLVLLAGNGDGTFQAPVTTTVGFDLSSILPADVNGDGRADLVETSSSAVSVQISNGDGTFQPPVTLASNGGCCWAFRVAVGPFGGGPLDILVSSGNTNVALYPGNGDGTFGAPVYVGLSNSANAITTGDFDGDGHEDFAVFSTNTGAVVFPGIGNRHFQTPVVYPALGSTIAMLGADLTGNGLPDVAVIGQGVVSTLVNARLGAHVPSVSVLVGSSATLTAAASGFGPITYQWRKNGTPLVDGGSISGATTAMLTIDPATFGDAGSYDVLVTDSCTSGASNAATLSVEFADVATTNIFHADIITIATAGVTSGCGGADYCPTSLVTRAQMSAFLLRSEHGSSYVPPACTGVFADVTCPSPFADWIEQLAAEGVTAGCGGGDYCPDASITRAQMAVFLLKTSQGSSYVPHPAVGIFGDVPPGSFAADWIEDLYNRGIAGGCSAAPLLYCPNNPVNRGQMAAFLVNTFF